MSLFEELSTAIMTARPATDTDRNLLVGALAHLTGMINTRQFTESCKRWGVRPGQALKDVLLELAYIAPDDMPHLEYLVERTLARFHGDAREALASLPLVMRQTLLTLADLHGESTPLDPKSKVPQRTAQRHSSEQESRQRRYALMNLHATGGIGRVWVAHDQLLDREVAIKELLPESAENARAAARFLREARLTGQLEHPGIVPVYEMAENGATQQPFYAMRLVRGRTLSRAIHEHYSNRGHGEAAALEFVALLAAFVAVCNTVAYAHARGVVHRDLKGDNVILGDFGEVIVLDWGLAKVMGQQEPAAANHGCDVVGIASERLKDWDVTVEGDVVGTPAYMAPEQATGSLDQIDQRTDIYGLGAILYAILTGRPPFGGLNLVDVLRQAAGGKPTPPRQVRADVPAALEAACLKAMAPKREERYASATELGQEVQRWQDDQRRLAEAALRRQSEVLRSILNSMSDGVLGADTRGNLLVINPAADRLLRRQGATTLAATRASVRFFRPDMVTPIASAELPLEQAIAGVEVNDAEMYLRPADESEGFWISSNARPLRDEHGELRGGVVVFRDITQRKRAEEDVRRSRERFELAVRGSQDGLWDWDLVSGAIYYSPRWKEILGYEDHEIASTLDEWEARLHPDERERVLAANFAHIQGVTPHYEYEYRLRHKDGSYRWILARGVALRDAAGKAYRMSGSHVDITERKHAEEERARLLQRESEARAQAEEAVRVLEEARTSLRASEAQYRSLADLIPGIVWTARADGWIDYANEFWFKYTGLNMDATQGSGWASVVHPDDWPRVAQLWGDALAAGQPVKVEYRIRRADGVYRRFLAQGRPVRDHDGQLMRWFGMLTEIDEG